MDRPTRNRHGSPRQARGMVTLVVILFLIGTVVFVLSQTLKISGNNVVDSQQAADGQAAFFVAESGIERAAASLTTALNGTTYTNASCTGVAGTTSIGRGSVVLSGQSSPATCSNSGAPGATACTSCAVTARATVGAATRSVTQNMDLNVRNGVFCTTNCTNNPNVTWQLTLRNTTTLGAIGIFNLAYFRGNNNNNTAACALGSNCQLQLDVVTGAGDEGTGFQGNAVAIPAGASWSIYQTMTQANSPLVEVGALIYGLTSTPTLTGPLSGTPPAAQPGWASYWDESSATGSRTTGTENTTTGRTNDGTEGAATGGTCQGPSANRQTCTSWCYGGDTLVYSFAGFSESEGGSTANAALTGVNFGTNANNVAMTPLVKYPTPNLAGAPTNVHAEIWFARNANLTGTSPEGLNASSYKGRGTGAVGASWSSTNNTGGQIVGTTLTVGSAFTGAAWPAQLILPGDTLFSTGANPNVSANTTIVRQLTSTEPGGMLTGQGGRGTYEVSTSQTVSGTGRTWTVRSSVLNVSACTLCFFAQGDAISLGTLSGGRSIAAPGQAAASNVYGRTETTGGIGRYPLTGGVSVPVASATTLRAGTPGTTLYIPSTSSSPAVTNPTMLLTVKSGTGTFASDTRVTAVADANPVTRSFTVSRQPTIALDLATICAGTCAFFAHGPAATTIFSLAGVNSGFESWASGFTCLKGVDVDPRNVSGRTAGPRRWRENVQ